MANQLQLIYLHKSSQTEKKNTNINTKYVKNS